MKHHHQPTVAVDFDGVLHSYTTPWRGAHVIPDPPVPGALEWLREISKDFQVVILSTRCRTWRGRRAIKQWLRSHTLVGFGFASWKDVDPYGSIRCSYKKLPAWVYIDDRAWRFTGDNFPSREEVHAARPWNKPQPKKIF